MTSEPCSFFLWFKAVSRAVCLHCCVLRTSSPLDVVTYQTSPCIIQTNHRHTHHGVYVCETNQGSFDPTRHALVTAGSQCDAILSTLTDKLETTTPLVTIPPRLSLSAWSRVDPVLVSNISTPLMATPRRLKSPWLHLYVNFKVLGRCYLPIRRITSL